MIGEEVERSACNPCVEDVLFSGVKGDVVNVLRDHGS